MNIVFLGTPDFAVPTLQAIRSARHTVPLVITQPDRPGGRGRGHFLPPRVKVAAGDVPVLQPEDVNAPDVQERIRLARPEVMVVVAFGQKLGCPLLTLAPRGCINAHASLLPRFRGASPIASAVLAGAEETGISVIRLVEKMDAGPILSRRVLPIGPEDTTEDLESRLAEVAATVVLELLAVWDSGKEVPKVEQDAALATYARKLRKEDGLVRWERTARRLGCFVRGMRPWPMAFTWFFPSSGKPLRVALRRARPGVDPANAPHPPGTILGLSDEGIQVATGDGTLEITELQPENRQAMEASSFANGWHVRPGDRFGIP